MQYSYSSISTFETCPRQYYHKHIIKDIKFTHNEAAKWGSDCHDAMDKAIKSNSLPEGRYAFLANVLDALYKKVGYGTLESEVPFGIDVSREPADFTTGWLRGKLDVLLDYNDTRGMIVDWKVAKPSAKYSLELDTFSYLVFKNKPHIQKLKRVLIWLKQDAPSPPTVDVVDRNQDFNRIEDSVCSKIDTIERCIESDNFPPKTSGLCKAYCDVLSCQFNGKSNARR